MRANITIILFRRFFAEPLFHGVSMVHFFSEKRDTNCDVKNLVGVYEQENLVKNFCDFAWSPAWKEQSKIFHFMPTILLYGPPGTGKTSILTNLAYGLEVNTKKYYRENLDLIINKELGETSKAIKCLFDELKEQASCGKKVFLQIDDIDSLLSSRNLSNESSGIRRGVNTFITQLDELLLESFTFPPIIAATTNMFDQIDSAVKRRFSLKIYVNPTLNDESIKDLISPMIKIIEPSLNINYRKVEDVVRAHQLTPNDLILAMQDLFLKKISGISVNQTIIYDKINQIESSAVNLTHKKKPSLSKL